MSDGDHVLEISADDIEDHVPVKLVTYAQIGDNAPTEIGTGTTSALATEDIRDVLADFFERAAEELRTSINND